MWLLFYMSYWRNVNALLASLLFIASSAVTQVLRYGNERADCLANKSPRGALTDSEPFCGVLKSDTKSLISQWTQKKSDCHWKQCAGCWRTKKFAKPSPTSHMLLELRRTDLRSGSQVPSDEWDIPSHPMSRWRGHLENRTQSVCRRLPT